MNKTAIKKTPTDIEVSEQKSITIVPQENSIVNFNLETIITQAINKGTPIETLERLLAMRQQLKDEWAKDQYTKAMSSFQGECPTIVKTKEVKTKSGIVAYKYAPIESIVEQVKPYLQKNGFSFSTGMEVLPDGVKVICKVTHINGHSEESPMQVPLGTKTDIMSQSQVTAAAQTFAKRYAFCNAFGILTGDEDTDASPTVDDSKQSSKDFPASVKQIETIKKMMEQKRLTEENLIDEGYDLKKLTGGYTGTASELITFLKGYIPKTQVTVQINGFTEDCNKMIERLNQCKDPAEFIDLTKMLTQYRQEGRFTKDDLIELKKVYEKNESLIMPKE